MEEFFTAVRTEDYEHVKYFIENGFDINTLNKDGQNALYEAVIEGKIEMATLLLDAGIDVNKASTHFKLSPLHWAVAMKNLDMCELLLEYKSNVLLGDANGDNALHSCVDYDVKPYKVTNFIVEHTGNINAQNLLGRTALHKAALLNDYDIAKILIENGASTNIGDSKGMNPLKLVEFTIEEIKTLKPLHEEYRKWLHEQKELPIEKRDRKPRVPPKSMPDERDYSKMMKLLRNE